MDLLRKPDFWKKGFALTFCIFCFMIGAGKMSLKEFGIPFSFGGNLSTLLFWPGVFLVGIHLTSEKKIFRINRRALFPFFLFLFWIGITANFHETSADSKASFFYFLSGLATFFLILSCLHDLNLLKKILLCLILGMTFSVLRGGFDYFFSAEKFGVTGTSDRRLFTPFGHPNFLGGALLLILPFAWTFDWKSSCKHFGRVLGIMVNGILVLGLLLSYSRSGWIGAVLSGLCLLFFSFRQELFKKIGVWTLLASCIFLGISLFQSADPSPKNSFYSRFRSVLDFKNDPNVIERIYVWKTSTTMIRDHAMFGIGPGNELFKKEFTEKHEPESMLLMPHAHNVLLQIAVVFGIPGLLLFIILIAFGIFNAWRERNAIDDFSRSLSMACLCSAIGFSVYSLMDCPLFADRVSPLFWAIVGMAYFRGEGQSKSSIGVPNDSEAVKSTNNRVHDNQ